MATAAFFLLPATSAAEGQQARGAGQGRMASTAAAGLWRGGQGDPILSHGWTTAEDSPPFEYHLG